MEIDARAHCWLVRAGRRGEHLQAFLDRGFVSLGFARADVGDLHEVDDEEIEARLAAVDRGFPGEDRKELVALRDMAVGDVVVTVDPGRREVIVGVVTGGYGYAEEPLVGDHRHHRPVRWLARWSRDDLPGPLGRDLSWQRTVRSLPDQEGWHALAVRSAAGEGAAA